MNKATVIARIKDEILADIKTGRVPSEVNSFDVLHSHVDANCYGGFCDEGSEIARLISTDPDRALQFMNECQAEIDDWLKAGRPCS